MMRKVILLLMMAVAAACSKPAPQAGYPFIYPDYVGVTIPVGIAPLNFDYQGAPHGCRTVFTAGDKSVVLKGDKVRWNPRKWSRLTHEAVVNGGVITVHSEPADSSWSIHVSADSIDYGLTYRLLEPGYEVYSKMGIYERDLSTFRQRAVLENTDFSGCVNCHSSAKGDPDRFSLHIRGGHGATLIRAGGGLAAYDTKTDSTLGFCVYPYWHPSGSYIAYSTNSTRQLFHVQPDKLIEVFDMASDIQVYDVASNELITAPQVKTDAYWETFPVFSADGGTVYFCRAAAKDIPDSLSVLHYNLCSVGFDPVAGKFSDDVRVLIDAEAEGKSISFPRPSYDGRYVMYTLSDYGQFSIWHHEADLWLYDVASGESVRLDAVNSPDTESFHNWSSGSRWFVFSSRRDDGRFTRLYIAHVDEAGNVGKPFMLPQKNPREYYGRLFMSYNVPEFVNAPVNLDFKEARRLIESEDRVKMRDRSN